MLALCYFVPFLKDFMGIFCFIFPRPGERQRCYGRVTYTTGSKNVEGCCVPTLQLHARGVLTLGPPVELLRVPALQGMEGLGKQPTKPNQTNKTSNAAHVLLAFTRQKAQGFLRSCGTGTSGRRTAGPVSRAAGRAV